MHTEFYIFKEEARGGTAFEKCGLKCKVKKSIRKKIQVFWERKLQFI